MAARAVPGHALRRRDRAQAHLHRSGGGRNREARHRRRRRRRPGHPAHADLRQRSSERLPGGRRRGHTPGGVRSAELRGGGHRADGARGRQAPRRNRDPPREGARGGERRDALLAAGARAFGRSLRAHDPPAGRARRNAARQSARTSRYDPGGQRHAQPSGCAFAPGHRARAFRDHRSPRAHSRGQARGEGRAAGAGGHRGRSAMPALCRARDRRCAPRSLSAARAGAIARLRGASDQQRRGRDQPRLAGAGTPSARLRPRQARRPPDPGPPGARRRADDHARREGAQAQRRRSGHRRRREAGGARRGDGGPHQRGRRSDYADPAGERDVRPGGSPPHLPAVRAAHRGLAPLRAGNGRARRRAGGESLRGPDRSARRRPPLARCDRRVPGAPRAGEGDGAVGARLGGARGRGRGGGGRSLAARPGARAGG